MLLRLLETLYRQSPIFDILNESVYITDFKKTKNTILLHTGVRFNLHTGKKVDLYFDIETKAVIRSPVNNSPNKPPQLLGLLCLIGETGYITDSLNRLAIGTNLNNDQEVNVMDFHDFRVLQEKETIYSVDLKDDNGKIVEHKYFEITDIENEIHKFTLYSNHLWTVFFNGYRFTNYIPRSDNRISNEDWYDSEFDEDAENAKWNTD